MIRACNGLEEVKLNYQNITYNVMKDTTNVGVNYNGHCDQLSIQFFSAEELRQGLQSSQQQRYISKTDPIVTLSSSELKLGGGEQTYIRIIAMENGTICSDVHSQQTFYHFENIGNTYS